MQKKYFLFALWKVDFKEHTCISETHKIRFFPFGTYFYFPGNKICYYGIYVLLAIMHASIDIRMLSPFQNFKYLFLF